MKAPSSSGVVIPDVLRDPRWRFCRVGRRSKRPVAGEKWADPANRRQYDDDALRAHLAAGGNYAVFGGPLNGGLVIVDADCDEMCRLIEGELPLTFTVRTGRESGDARHYYFYCPDFPDGDIPMMTGAKNVGHIKAKGYVVGPGSMHKDTGLPYEVVLDMPITTVTKDQLLATFKPYMAPDGPGTGPSKHAWPPLNTTPEYDLKALRIESVVITTGLTQHGVEWKGSHPVHGSDTGNNFEIDTSKNLWHCFRCGTGGDPLYWVAVREGILECSAVRPGALTGAIFLRACEAAVQKYGLRARPSGASPAVQPPPLAVAGAGTGDAVAPAAAPAPAPSPPGGPSAVPATAPLAYSLDGWADAVDRAGVLGEESLAKLVLLVYVSPRVKPVHLMIVSPSETGKSYLQQTSERLLGEMKISSMSRLGICLAEPTNRCIFVGEMNFGRKGMGEEDMEAFEVLRQFMSEQYYRHVMADPKSRDGKREYVVVGPTSFVFTSTAPPPGEENANRFIIARTSAYKARHADITARMWSDFTPQIDPRWAGFRAAIANRKTRVCPECMGRVDRAGMNTIGFRDQNVIQSLWKCIGIVNDVPVVGEKEYNEMRLILAATVYVSALPGVSGLGREIVEYLTGLKGPDGQADTKDGITKAVGRRNANVVQVTLSRMKAQGIVELDEFETETTQYGTRRQRRDRPLWRLIYDPPSITIPPLMPQKTLDVTGDVMGYATVRCDGCYHSIIGVSGHSTDVAVSGSITKMGGDAPNAMTDCDTDGAPTVASHDMVGDTGARPPVFVIDPLTSTSVDPPIHADNNPSHPTMVEGNNITGNNPAPGGNPPIPPAAVALQPPARREFAPADYGDITSGPPHALAGCACPECEDWRAMNPPKPGPSGGA